MPSIIQSSSNNMARILAVVALLFVLGGQQIETAHYHTGSDSTSSCVHCHNAGGVALLNSHSGVLLPVLAAVLFLVCIQPVFSTLVETTRVRGPPHNS